MLTDMFTASLARAPLVTHLWLIAGNTAIIESHLGAAAFGLLQQFFTALPVGGNWESSI